jgi:hypothetical protein
MDNEIIEEAPLFKYFFVSKFSCGLRDCVFSSKIGIEEC